MPSTAATDAARDGACGSLRARRHMVLGVRMKRGAYRRGHSVASVWLSGFMQSREIETVTRSKAACVV